MGTVRISEFNSEPNTTFVVEGDYLSSSVAGNYSVVRCYLVAKNGPGGTSNSGYGNAGLQTGTIVGVKEFARRNVTPFLPTGVANGATRWRLGPYDVQVDHDADGTHAPIRFGMVLNYGSISETILSGEMALPTIARASKARFEPSSSFDAGAPVDIKTGRASTSFTHDITYTFGTKTGLIAAALPTDTTWTPPLTLLSEIPDATSGPGHIMTVTKNGATVVGTTTTPFTLRAPASVVPTVSSVTVADQNSDVASLVGKFVQGLSRAKFTVNGAGASGSTITDSEVTFQGQAIAQGADALVTQSGNVPVVGRVTDSRGRVGTGNATLPVLAYSAPAITAYQARRCNSVGGVIDEGTYLRVDLTGAIASLLNGTERNLLTIRAFTRPRGTGAWTARNVVTPGGVTYNTWFLVSGGAAFSTLGSFDVRVELRDRFGAYVADTSVSTASVALDMNGTNVGVGKIWEQGVLDVAGQIFQGGLPVIDSGDVASETVPGIAERATQAEVDAGADTTRFVSSKTLRERAYAPYSVAAGQGASAATGDVTVTFPAGRFTQPPRVAVTPLFHANVLVPRLATNPTATSFTVALFRVTEVRIASSFDWTATQMTAGSGSG